MIDDLMDIVFMVVMIGGIIFALSMLVLLIVAIFTPQPKPLQNVVCDTSYGVQYFEHKGVLTLRVNHEGVPIRCFE